MLSRSARTRRRYNLKNIYIYIFAFNQHRINFFLCIHQYFFTSFSAREKSYLGVFRMWQNTLMDKVRRLRQHVVAKKIKTQAFVWGKDQTVRACLLFYNMFERITLCSGTKLKINLEDLCFHLLHS